MRELAWMRLLFRSSIDPPEQKGGRKREKRSDFKVVNRSERQKVGGQQTIHVSLGGGGERNKVWCHKDPAKAVSQ